LLLGQRYAISLVLGVLIMLLFIDLNSLLSSSRNSVWGLSTMGVKLLSLYFSLNKVFLEGFIEALR